MDTAQSVLSYIMKGQGILRLLTIFGLTDFLWPAQDIEQGCRIFDMIVVGGGTAGCIIASNLAKLKFNVLLIEAGGTPTLETMLPGLFTYLKNMDYDWNFTSTSDEFTMRKHIHQGKVLGGSSQVGYMFYAQPNPKDYDEWATITNDSSWSYKNVLPLFKRTEKVIDKSILNSPDKYFHGTKGNLQITKYHSAINDGHFEAYEELGYDVVNDINPHKPGGFTNTYLTIGSRIRQSTANAFITPEKDNPHLHVMYHSLATKIIFDEYKKAIGVEVLTKDQKCVTMKAKKEVIVTAGAIKTPQLLMLSGIGPKNYLKSKNIKVISDLPVGHNLQDNVVCILAYKMGKPGPVTPQNPHEFPAVIVDGYIAVNKSQGRADYQTLSGVVKDPKLFLVLCRFIYSLSNDICDNLYNSSFGRQIYLVSNNLLYSKSYGKILLNSTDPRAKPIINLGYYSNGKDFENHAKYLEHYHAVVNTTYYKSVRAELADPGLKACNGLERYSNEYWKCYVREMHSTLYNFGGTCAMSSVVDSKLRVMGVKNLRVGDASIMPKMVGTQAQATVMMIAQKLTDILKNHHRL